MAKIDLHIHSNHSDDGEFSVPQLIDMCKNNSMKMISVTDHNSAKSAAQAIQLGKEAGIKVLSGVEIDCTYKELNFHILGYGFDYSRKEFIEIEEDIFRQEVNAASEKISKLRKATGLDISENEVFDAAGGSVVTGELIGEIILNKEGADSYEILRPYLKGGAKSDMPYVNFYWDFFSQGKAAYMPIHYMSLNEAAELIHHANGMSVLAHPAQNLKDIFPLIDEIAKEGIDGIEAFSSYHTADESEYFLKKARQHKLLVTCGSDFHGKNKPQIGIGDCNLSIDEDIILNGLLSNQI